MTPFQEFSDYHSQLGNGFSITDPSSWQEIPGNAVKFTAAALGSGLNSFYNTGVAVGNFFGADLEERDTAAWLSDIDSDLGQYYQENKTGADIVGFIAGSLIPGTLAVKSLNYGAKALRLVEAGAAGSNATMHTGILGSRIAKSTQEAIRSYKESGALFSAWNTKFLKAAGQGLAQDILEAGVFEAAVQATMHKSPILDDQDMGDVIKNTLTGAVVGGVFSSAFRTAKLVKQVKTGIAEADAAYAPFASRTEAGGNMTADMKMAQALQDKVRISSLVAEDNRALSIQKSSLKDIDIDIRKYAHELVPGDKDLANNLADRLIAGDAGEVSLQIMNTARVGRLGDNLPDLQQHIDLLHGKAARVQKQTTTLEQLQVQLAEAEAAKDAKAIAKINKKIARQVEAIDAADAKLPSRTLVDPVTGKEVAMPQKLQEVFLDMHTGEILEQRPGVLNFADKVARKTGETVKQALDRAIKEQKIGQTALKETDYLSADKMDLYWRWAESEFGAGKKLALNAGENLDEAVAIAADDLPALQTILRNQDFETLAVDFGDDAVQALTKDDVAKLVFKLKDTLAVRLAKEGKTAAEISRAIDVNPKVLEGQRLGWGRDEVMYHRDTLRQAKVDPDMPQHLHMIKDVSFTQTPFEVDAITTLRSEAKISAMRRNDAVEEVLGENHSSKFVEFREEHFAQANREGAHPGLVTATNGDVLSLTGVCQYLGSQVHQMRADFAGRVEAYLGSAANQLQSNPISAQRFSRINAQVASTTEEYFIGSKDGVMGLVSGKLKKYEADLIKAEKAGIDPSLIKMEPLQEGALDFISFEGDEVLQSAVTSHIGQAFEHQSGIAKVRYARGETYHQVKSGRFVPLRPDPRDFPHFAFVIDPTITGAGRVRMISAQTAEDLRKLADGVDRTRFDVQFKSESEAFHKAMKDFDWDLTLHESYYDAGKQSAGRAAPFYPLTDPNAIARNFMEYHKKQADHMVREAIKTKYAAEFDTLEKLGLQHSQAATSRFAGFGKFGQEKTVNPYQSYAKTILDIPQKELMPTYFGVSNTLDAAFSKMWQHIENINPFGGSEKSVDEAYAAMTKAGYNTAYVGAAEGMYDLINKTASRGVLSKFIRTTNVVLGNVLLRSDMMNAVNNFIGSNVLEGPELSLLIKRIEQRSGKVGALAKMEITAPTGDKIYSPMKLIAEGRIKALTGRNDPEVKQFILDMENRGMLPKVSDLVNGLLDDMTLAGKDTDSIIGQKLGRMKEAAKTLGEKAESWSGNKYAEFSNRFTTAWSTKQITDEAVRQGILSPNEAWAVINTQMNRIHGNITASQRPLLFQGAAGQALGLFQSYQFNLMQQLFRHVGEGEGKTALMALGLQGSLYGMHGMPGFDFVNTHIIGQAAGNTSHQDIYTKTYGTVGKDVGEWLIYGMPSALSGMAVYTRGDINPRHATILPLDPTQLPQWQIPAKVLGNMFTTFEALGDGGDAKAVLLRGLERNGASRPLAGLGAIMQGFTTTGEGNISYAGPKEWGADMATLLHLGRLTGGKPMQDAVVSDALFRQSTYAAADRKRRDEIADTMKIGMIGEEMPSMEQLQGFQQKYYEAGGKQGNFARWASQQYRRANEAEANKLAGNLLDPRSIQLQELMGGERPDFWE